MLPACLPEHTALSKGGSDALHAGVGSEGNCPFEGECKAKVTLAARAGISGRSLEPGVVARLSRSALLRSYKLL